MTGWLIVNKFLNTPKFIELQELFMTAASKCGVGLRKYTNADFAISCTSGEVISDAFLDGIPDFIIFYDKDLELATAFEEMGIPLFNEAAAIKICDDKYLSLKCIYEYNEAEKSRTSKEVIVVPKTIKVPFTYENIGINPDDAEQFLESIENEVSYPLVVKECYSSFGMGVHLAGSREEAAKFISEFGNKQCILQEYINPFDEKIEGINAENVPGLDVRLQMVGYKCVAAMKRSNDGDFRANITNGGKMDTFEPSDELIEMAGKVMDAIGLDFAGLDFMFDKDGRAVFIEANSNAHFKNLFDLTGVNAAEAMIEYILDKISDK